MKYSVVLIKRGKQEFLASAHPSTTFGYFHVCKHSLGEENICQHEVYDYFSPNLEL